MDELDDIFDETSALDAPTIRGNANLDIQDYAKEDGGPDTFLDDELQEDIPSRPGDGAGPATDVVGTASMEMAEDVDDDAPGMRQTTYGYQPWGPGDRGSGLGYRPMSMQRTDMSELSGDDYAPPSAALAKPEVRMMRTDIERVEPAHEEQFNPEPSNAEVNPETLYDRDSFEYTDDPQDTIGTGIFDMEEGVTFRARDGIFAHGYALPAYVADDGELDVSQSEMWDSVANNWTVTQPSASGVTLSKRVDKLKSRAYSPFMQTPPPDMRPEVTGPRSHIEAFGRAAAKCLVGEARLYKDANGRSKFLTAALEALGPKMAVRSRSVADRLVQLGYQPEMALEDTVAHAIMHATLSDLKDRNRTGTLPRLDRMGVTVRAHQPQLKSAAQQHLQPLVADPKAMQTDLAGFYQSPAAAGMGEVAAEQPAAAASMLTPRNLLIGVAVLGVGYYALKHTKAGKKVERNAMRQWRKLTRKAKRRSRKARSR